MSCTIAVFGTGYLGATHAVCMAELGHDVIAMDVDERKIESLSQGHVPFFEPGLEELLRKVLATGRLRFTTSYAEAALSATVHFLCVGTPQRRDGLAADLSYLDSVVSGVLPYLEPDDVVVGKSTVPVGTAEAIASRIRTESPVGERVAVAWNPEFLREGFAVEDTLRPDRLVFGVRDDHSEKVLREVYANVVDTGCPVVVTDVATAQLTKVAANAFLATKISFINAVAEVCDAAGADVTDLADAIGHDERIGRRFLNAGVGFGGGCLPKDLRAFMARAGELGVDDALSFLREVDLINMRQRTRIVELAREMVGSFVGSRIAVLGAAFKPDSDDVRDSPALNVAGRMHLHGAQVCVHDPRANANARTLFPTLDYADSVDDACQQADLVVLLTEWRDFRSLDPEVVGSCVRRRRLIDARNALDPDQWRAAGWQYRGIGRPTR